MELGVLWGDHLGKHSWDHGAWCSGPNHKDRRTAEEAESMFIAGNR